MRPFFLTIVRWLLGKLCSERQVLLCIVQREWKYLGFFSFRVGRIASKKLSWK